MTDVSFVQITAHVAYAAVLAGTWLVGKRRRYGWLMQVAGSCGMAVAWYAAGAWSVVAWSAAFITMQLLGWWRWRE